MARRRQPEGPGHPEPHRNTMQLRLAVVGEILAGVDDVEPRHPRRYGRPEDNRRQQVGRMPGDRLPPNGNPGGNRRHRQGYPQPEMGQRCKPLGIAVPAQKREHRHSQIERQPVRQKQQRARHKPRATRDGKERHLAGAQQPRGNMPPRRPRIQGVELPIKQPIKRQRRAAGEDHAKEDADEFLPADLERRRTRCEPRNPKS